MTKNVQEPLACIVSKFGNAYSAYLEAITTNLSQNHARLSNYYALHSVISLLSDNIVQFELDTTLVTDMVLFDQVSILHTTLI